MIEDGVLSLIFIRFVIVAVRAVTPLCAAYLALAWAYHEWASLPLITYALLEISFYLFVYLPRSHQLQEFSSHKPAPPTRAQRRKFLLQTLQTAYVQTTSKLPYPTGWFLPTDRPPHREDVVDWILWAMFDTDRHDAAFEAEHKAEMDEYVKEIERAVGQKLLPGHEPSGLKPMRASWDPVDMRHRPLIWYMAIAGLDMVASISLYALGFVHYTPREFEHKFSFPPRPVLHLLSRTAPEGVSLPYWYRPHCSSTKRPLLYIHGIGVGLFPYLLFLQNIIREDSDVGIILPELLSISMRLTPAPLPPRALMLRSLCTILETAESLEIGPKGPASRRLAYPSETQPLVRSTTRQPGGEGWNKVVLMGHSYGTFVVGWIMRACVDSSLSEEERDPGLVLTNSREDAAQLNSKISSIVLVDPVPILIAHPSVCHNFLYQRPSTVGPSSNMCVLPEGHPDVGSTKTKSWFSSATAWAFWYFASKDADISRTLFRSFFWTEGCLFREELTRFMEMGWKSQRTINGAKGSDAAADAHGVGNEEEGRETRKLAIFLGGRDQIVPAEPIRYYLTGEKNPSSKWSATVDKFDRSFDEGVLGLPSRTRTCWFSNRARTQKEEEPLEVHFNPTFNHGTIFFTPRDVKPLVETVCRLVREG